MRGDQRLERGEDSFEGRVGGPVAEPPVRILKQLLEPLVAFVQWLEERERISYVDQNGRATIGRELPDRRQPLVVRHEELAAIVLDPQAEVLPDLDAFPTLIQASTKLSRQPLAEPRL